MTRMGQGIMAWCMCVEDGDFEQCCKIVN